MLIIFHIDAVLLCMCFYVMQSAVYESIKEHGHQVDLLFGSTVSALRVERTDENTVGPAVVTLSTPSDTSSEGLRTLTAR